MPIAERVYEVALRGVRPLTRLAPATGKVGRGIEARRGVVRRLTEWARAHRDPGRPLVWLHAPSVGEALMAQAIAGALRHADDRLQLAFTFFSPSAERAAVHVGADVADYLPWDIAADVRRVLAALEPAVIAFVRTEIWPVLTREAARTGVRLALLNAVLGARSSRTGRSARALLAPAYRRLDRVGAVSPSDAARFGMLGVSAENVRITGDARFDQVHARVQRIDVGAPLLRRLADPDALTLVAGSTWPADEDRLVPAFAALRAASGARLIIAPHEPTTAHLERLERTLAAHRVTGQRLSAVEDGTGMLPHAVIVDRVGILADLYTVADIAYIGGGFGRSGLHSVVEPAALEKPVIYGPHHGNAAEAQALAAEGGGVVVHEGGELLATLSRLLARPEDRLAAGEAARRFVETRLGAAARNAELVLQLRRRAGWRRVS